MTSNRPLQTPLTPLAALVAGLSMAPLASAQAVPAETQAVLPAVRATATAEPAGKETLRATTTRIGKGRQELRDVPQSVTVVTEKLLDDRNLDTLKDTLKNTAGISFQAAEGGEEDIRLRGFSLQSTGDIFIDGMRDPAFYDRDSFNWDRLEVLRGSASMLFGRGSTGGAVNQVSKLPSLLTQHEVAVTIGSGGYVRGTGDFNLVTGDSAALRVNTMMTVADNAGAKVDKRGIAPTFRWGIGGADEFALGAFHLQNDNGVHYGLPWLRTADGGTTLWPTDPSNYYGMASDYNATGTTQLWGSHVHRFADRGELRSQLRVAEYRRDQRASAIRFADTDPATPGNQSPTEDDFGAGTVLRRSNGTGVQLKNMSLDAAYAQSDYSGTHQWLGREHRLAAGVDLAAERFRNLGLADDSPVLVKPETTVGTPNDGAWIDESLRLLQLSRRFEANAVGVYAQDLVQIAPHWKLLGGLRWDRFEGRYETLTGQGRPGDACAVGAGTTLRRSDSLWSKRLGVLYQPSEHQSYHFSYGTSFNTSGDTYQFDAGSAQTAPESSRNIELGARLDAADGRVTTRVALFHTTKYNERNRDAESVDACNYVLSGERHAAGLELDVAGRLTRDWEVFASLAYIPEAEVDASSGAPGTEEVGSRPGLTPRFSGTVWTTYRLSPRWRVGGGLNARSAIRPVGLPAESTTEAPRYLTADLMAEYTQGDLSLRANLTNLANAHYADQVYRGHYVPGKPRTLQLTAAYTFY